MIDIGANLTNSTFREDRDDVIARAFTAGLQGIVVTGTNIAESRAAAELCRQWPGRLYCTAGVHPHDAGRVEDGWLEALADLQAHEAVRAVGETGLDFNRNYSTPDRQRTVFRMQIDLAVRVQKPLFVHERDSEGEVAACLAEHDGALPPVVVHCFTGSADDLERYLAADYYIGITGWVCDERRGRTLQRTLPEIPDNRLLIETDAPFLTPRTIPRPQRSRRNEPANLVWVARRVAELRGQHVHDVQRYTAENAVRFFGIQPGSSR